MRPSPKASSSDSIGYRLASVRNNGACGWRLSSVRAVAWQREHSLARRASPRLRAAAAWAHAAEVAKTMESRLSSATCRSPYAVHPARRRRHHITMEEMPFSLSPYRRGKSCNKAVAGLSQWVRPLAGPVAGSGRTRWLHPGYARTALVFEQAFLMFSLATPSKIRLGGNREADVLVAVESSRVFSARDLRPFETVARINHARGPGRREG